MAKNFQNVTNIPLFNNIKCEHYILKIRQYHMFILDFFIGLGCALNNIQTPQFFTNINVRYMIF